MEHNKRIINNIALDITIKSEIMAMYFINMRVKDGWEHEYPHFEDDADAMIYGRNKLGATCSMVAIYRHDDEDTCGVKHFLVAYQR